MYLLYLDDSGSVHNTQESYFVLGGICVFERQVYWLTKKLDELAAEIWPASPESVEFHASEIFSGRAHPWKALPKEERKKVLIKVLKIIADSHESTRAFACAVHKASFPGKDPIEIAFEQLCSRFDLYLKRIYATDSSNSQRGIFILDESSYETSLQNLANNFRSFGTRWGVLKNIVEVPFFVNSKASRIVQLADHIAYSVFRRYDAGDTSYLDIVLSKFDAENGKLHGLVHKQQSNINCLCPACMSRNLG